MAALPKEVTDPVASAIFAHYKAKYSLESPRGYVGASSIGKSCSRALWYGFRWAKQAQFDGRLYRLFQSGHHEEPRVYADLRAIGCEVFDTNPTTGQQFAFTEPSTGNHFRGNCDGIITGVPGAEKSAHILEIKTSSDKLFKVLQKDGVEKAKPEHFAQIAIYMKWSIDQFGEDGCRRALYVCVCKNTDEIYTERLEYRPEVAKALIDKASAVIKATEPPPGISIDQSYFECKFCDYRSLCFGQDVPAPTCRSCAHSTPELDGDARWSCAAHKADIPLEAQREGCSRHLYIPILLVNTGAAVDATDDSVTYQSSLGHQIVNGDPALNPSHISSWTIHATEDKATIGVFKDVV